MRTLTITQELRIEKAMWRAGYSGYLDCADLEDIVIDGRLSLTQLRLLVDLLRVCHDEEDERDD